MQTWTDMEYTLTDTGERYVPWSGDLITGYEHAHRYLLASHYARDKRVLDISCGEGYGTAMLARIARSVIGVDVDATTVAHARRHHDGPNVSFIRADAQRFALAPGSIDLVVSFETIEHFEAQTAFLTAMKSSLAPSGIMLISTPNVRTYRTETEDPNRFHKRELDRAEFLDLLRQYFRNVQLYGQRLITSSAITRDKAGVILRENERVRLIVTESDAMKGEYPLHADSTMAPRYHLAVCSDGALPPLPNSLMVDNKDALYADLLTHFTGWNDLNEERLGLQQSLDETKAQTQRMQSTLRARQTRLQQTQEELASSSNELHETRGELGRTREQLSQVHGQLHRADSELHETRGQMQQVQSELHETRSELDRTREQLSQAHAQLHRADTDMARAQERLARALAIRTPGTNASPSRNGRRSRKALVVVPGSVNYFYNQAGRRIATAMRTLGFDVDVHTPQSFTEGEYDWCFLVNPYELTVSYGDQAAGLTRVRAITKRANRNAAVLLECAQTPWFRHSCHVCRETGIDTLLDFGFHDQSASLPPGILPRYQFVFNGLTEPERRKIYEEEGAIANDHAIPWVFVGHLSRSRVGLVSRLLEEANPGGLIYMPHLTPVSEDGPHINEQQFERILVHTRYQIWCAHHEHLYLESERFRNSLLSGSLPVKVLLHPLATPAPLPFRYLLFEEDRLADGLNTLDHDFDATWQRFKEDFRRLPTLEDSMVDALAVMGEGRG